MYSRNRVLCRSKKQREGRSPGGTDPLSVQTGLHLHEATVVEQREVFENLLDMLLVRTRADQQGIRRIDHDIVVQRIHHDDLLSGRLDQAVRRIVEFRVGRHDIAIGVLGREFVKRAPGSDVVPAEIRTPHENIIGTFQHAVVDRDRRTARKDILHGVWLLGRSESVGLSGKKAIYLRKAAFERCEDAPRRPDEDAGIPQVIAGGQIAHGGLQIGFLAERYNGRNLPGGCSLDVAVARIGTRGTDTNGNQRVVRLGELHAGGDVAAELLLIEDEVVGRRHDHRRIRVQCPKAEGRIGDAGSRIASDGFAQHLFGPELGELFENQLPVGGIRDDKEVLRRNDRRKTLECMADETLPGAQNIEELLGEMASAGRPEPATDTSGHNDAIAIYSIRHIPNSKGKLKKAEKDEPLSK